MKAKTRYLAALALAIASAGCWSRLDNIGPPCAVIQVFAFKRYKDLTVDGKSVGTNLDGDIIACVDQGNHVLRGEFDGKILDLLFKMTAKATKQGYSEYYLSIIADPPPAHFRQ